MLRTHFDLLNNISNSELKEWFLDKLLENEDKPLGDDYWFKDVREEWKAEIISITLQLVDMPVESIELLAKQMDKERNECLDSELMNYKEFSEELYQMLVKSEFFTFHFHSYNGVRSSHWGNSDLDNFEKAVFELYHDIISTYQTYFD